jgi:hypothetical protein
MHGMYACVRVGCRQETEVMDGLLLLREYKGASVSEEVSGRAGERGSKLAHPLTHMQTALTGDRRCAIMRTLHLTEEKL